MLVFAKQYEDLYKQVARTICLDDKYKWYNTGYIYIPNFEDTDWDNVRRLSISDENKLLGYFNATVDRTNFIVTNVSIWSVTNTYKEYKTFEYDLLTFIKYLLQFNSIQFCVIIGNHVQSKYRKFIDLIGGNIVGTHHKCCKINGEMYDEELYEIIPNKQVKNKLQELIDRRK